MQYLTEMSKYSILRKLTLLISLIFFIFLAWRYYENGRFILAVVERYIELYPIFAFFIFIFAYIVSSVMLLPTLPLNLAGGFFWGGILGGIYSALGATLGGFISFSIVRLSIGQRLTDNFERKWVKELQTGFKKNDWKFVAFLRVNPIIPTGPLNYLLGLTSLSRYKFLWTTFVFLLLPAIAVAYIGGSLHEYSTQDATTKESIKNISIASAAIVFLALIKFVAIIYKKRTKE